MEESRGETVVLSTGLKDKPAIDRSMFSDVDEDEDDEDEYVSSDGADADMVDEDED